MWRSFLSAYQRYRLWILLLESWSSGSSSCFRECRRRLCPVGYGNATVGSLVQQAINLPDVDSGFRIAAPYLITDRVCFALVELVSDPLVSFGSSFGTCRSLRRACENLLVRNFLESVIASFWVRVRAFFERVNAYFSGRIRAYLSLAKPCRPWRAAVGRAQLVDADHHALNQAGVLPLVVEVLSALEQIPMLIDEVADGARDFSPPPSQVQAAARRSYRARARTLLVR